MEIADFRIKIGRLKNHLRTGHGAKIGDGNNLFIAMFALIQIHHEVLGHVRKIGDDSAGGAEGLVAGVRRHVVNDFLVVFAIGVGHVWR